MNDPQGRYATSEMPVERVSWVYLRTGETISWWPELEDVAEVTYAFAKYVARQEDDFLPLGTTAAVRASKVFHLEHAGFTKAK